MSGSGLSAMIHAGAWLENGFAMEAIAFDRGATSDEDCVLEICGQWLAYHIALRGAEVQMLLQRGGVTSLEFGRIANR